MKTSGSLNALKRLAAGGRPARSRLRLLAGAAILGIATAPGAFGMTETSGEAMPWESGLTIVMESISGPTAKIIGVILIVGAGIALAFTEGQAMRRIFWVVIGLGIALNATSLLSGLFGTAEGFLLPASSLAR